MKKSKIHKRRSIRLKGYDYSKEGLYHITICCQDRRCLFGKIISGNLYLNDAGKMVEHEWLQMPERFNNIHLREFVVMPNHFHGIVEIIDVGATLVVARDGNKLSNIDPIPTIRGNKIDSEALDDVNSEELDDVNSEELDDVDSEELDDVDSDDGNRQIDHRIPKKAQPQGIAPTRKTVGDIVGAFKSITTVEYIHGVKNMNWPRFNGKLWQRNYHDHIIRDELSYRRVAHYIKTNPENWTDDNFYTTENK